MYAPKHDISLFIKGRWMNYLYSMFNYMCTQNIVSTSTTARLKDGSLKTYDQLLLYSMQLPGLLPIWGLLYENKQKTIRPDINNWFWAAARPYFLWVLPLFRPWFLWVPLPFFMGYPEKKRPKKGRVSLP